MNGEAQRSISIIESTKENFKQYGLDPMYYFEVKKDSIYFHRFYFHKSDTSLKIIIKTQGVQSVENIKIPGKPTFDLRALDEIRAEIDSLGYLEVGESKDLLFLYANAPEDKNPLWCPAGMPRETVMRSFIMFSAREYKNHIK